ncbi:MAG: hypothetical protein AAGE18_10320 [Pseudomonadota bacterium]
MVARNVEGLRMMAERTWLQIGLPRREWLIAGAVSLIWITTLASYGAGFFGLFGPSDAPRDAASLEITLFLLAGVLPLVFIWLVAILATQIAETRAEAAALARSLAAMRPTANTGSVDPQQAELAMARAAKAAARQAVDVERGHIEAALARLEERQQVTDKALCALLEGQEAGRAVLSETAALAARAASKATATAAAASPGQDPAQPGADQPALPFPKGEADKAPPSFDDILTALNFPTNAEDKAGFRALRRAVRNRTVGLLLQAAEDVLNLLAQDGIYMDDLPPEATEPALWRAFSAGQRGPEVDALGAIDDPTAIALCRGRLRKDPIFRDTALHFLRRFDEVLTEICAAGDDGLLVRLAETRSARAFMLLARVGGSFD